MTVLEEIVGKNLALMKDSAKGVDRAVVTKGLTTREYSHIEGQSILEIGIYFIYDPESGLIKEISGNNKLSQEKQGKFIYNNTPVQTYLSKLEYDPRDRIEPDASSTIEETMKRYNLWLGEDRTAKPKEAPQRSILSLMIEAVRKIITKRKL